MFEHALLSSGPRTGKTRAVAFAFTGQMVCVAGVVMASMFYAEKLVTPHIMRIVAPPLMHEQPVVEVKRSEAAAGPSVTTPVNVRVYHAPTSTHRHYVMDVGAPELTPLVDGLVSEHGSGIPGLNSGVGTPALAMPDAPPPIAKQPAPAKLKGPLRIGGDVAGALLLHKVLPVYPALAKQMRLAGVVELHGIIGRDGRIQELRVISGHPLLVGAALEAVKQWVYRPTLLNGEPVEVSAPIQVRFTLGSE